MRFAAAVLAVLSLAIPASADDDAVKKKAEDLVEELATGQDYGKRTKLLAGLRNKPGAVEAFAAAAAGRADLDDKGWSIAQNGAPLFEAQRQSAIPVLKKLLADKEPRLQRFALTVAGGAGLVPALAEEIVAMLGSEDMSTASTAQSVFANIRDAHVLELLSKKAQSGGREAENAIHALAMTSAESPRPLLRKIAGDASAKPNLRISALSALEGRPEPADCDLAIELLKSDDDSIVSTSIQFLISARAAVPVAALKAVKAGGNAWTQEGVLKLLCAAGDADSVKAALSRAKGGEAWSKAEWYMWIGRSGIKEVRGDLEKAFGEETDDNARMGILVAIGEIGDPAAIDMISKYLTHPEQGYQALRSLAALARRTPETIDGILDRLADVQGFGQCGVDSFYFSFLEVNPTPEARAKLFDSYLKLLERVQDKPRVRWAVLSSLSDMARPDFGQTEEATSKWHEWWGANREAFVKLVPKHQ